jgi:hypothetical protein
MDLSDETPQTANMRAPDNTAFGRKDYRGIYISARVVWRVLSKDGTSGRKLSFGYGALSRVLGSRFCVGSSRKAALQDESQGFPGFVTGQMLIDSVL